MRKVQIDLVLSTDPCKLFSLPTGKQAIWKRFLVFAEDGSCISDLKECICETFTEMYPDEGQIYIYGHLKDSNMADLADKYKIEDILDEKERNLIAFCTRGQVKRGIEDVQESTVSLKPHDDTKPIVEKKLSKSNVIAKESEINTKSKEFLSEVKHQANSDKNSSLAFEQPSLQECSTENSPAIHENNNLTKTISVEEHPNQPKSTEANPTNNFTLPTESIANDLPKDLADEKVCPIENGVSNPKPKKIKRKSTTLPSNTEQSEKLSSHGDSTDSISKPDQSIPVTTQHSTDIFASHNSDSNILIQSPTLVDQIPKKKTTVKKKPIVAEPESTTPTNSNTDLKIQSEKLFKYAVQSINSSEKPLKSPTEKSVKKVENDNAKKITEIQSVQNSPSIATAPYPSVKNISLPKKTAVRKVFPASQVATMENTKNIQLANYNDESGDEIEPNNSAVYSSNLFK